MSKILLAFALDIEQRGLFDDFDRVDCGVGKVNATHYLTKELVLRIARGGPIPQLVINLGSAGSQAFPTGTVVNCTRFVQRDMDTTSLGTPAFVTPYDKYSEPYETGMRWNLLPEGICGTGDNFVTTASVHPWNVIDMEAFALAKVCRLNNVGFGCLKYISDGADGTAANNWEQALEDGAHALRAGLLSVLS